MGIRISIPDDKPVHHLVEEETSIPDDKPDCQTDEDAIDVPGSKQISQPDSPDDLAEEAIRLGDIDTLTELLPKGLSVNWLAGIAAFYGRVDMVQLLLSHGATNIRWIVNHAAAGSQRDILAMFPDSLDLGEIACVAIRGNQSGFATELSDKLTPDQLTTLACEAAKSGYCMMIPSLIDKGAAVTDQLIIEMIEMSPERAIPLLDKGVDHDLIVMEAIRKRFLPLLTEAIDLYSDLGVAVLDSVAEWAAQNGHSELLLKALDKGATNLDQCAFICAEKGNTTMLFRLLGRGARNIDVIASLASGRGDRELVLELIDRGATNFAELAGEAAYNDHFDLARELTEKAAGNYDYIASMIDSYSKEAMKLRRFLVELGASYSP